MEQNDINPTMPNGNSMTGFTDPVVPVDSVHSVVDKSAGAVPARPVAAPVNTSVAPVTDSQPVNPTIPTSINPAVSQSGQGNMTITPTGQDNLAAPSAPANAPVGVPVNAPVAEQPALGAPVPPVFRPGGASAVGGVGTLSATEAIMRPEPAPKPDPEEEELKAPMKAAAPVPGSIGSAVSVPASANISGAEDGKVPPSVSFNDPATVSDASHSALTSVKKRTSKGTLVIIAILGVMVVVALAVVLIFMRKG